MQPAGELAEVFALLEGDPGAAGGGGGALAALFGGVRDSWLARGLLAYHARTGSTRALDALARAPEPHARALLDALAEQLAGDLSARRAALAALAPLVARRPAWLHRLPQHALLGQLLRLARVEPEPHARLHALLALAALGAHAPHLLPVGAELADALLAAAAAPEPHAALAAHALFASLYAAAPAALVQALRRELDAAGAGGGGGARRAGLARGLPRLLGGARLLPLLLTGAELERASPPPGAPPPAPPPPEPVPAGAAALTARAVSALRPPAEPWFSLSERCGADSAPHTPLPPEGSTPGGEGGSPPEAAVEATPENTPAKETRGQFTFPVESSSVRALGRLSAPPSPLRGGAGGAGGEGAHAARLARVVRERAPSGPPPPHSPVPFGAAAPPLAARPEPRPAAPAPLSARALDAELSEARPWPPPPPPAAPARLRRPPARARPPPRRAASCPPTPSPARTHTGAQTVHTCPEPYEFVLHDLYASLPEDPYKEWSEPAPVSPSARLDEYLARLYVGGDTAGDVTALTSQLALTHALLMFERWRREAHAERNRRLLGRVRQARALELSCAALRDRVRALTRDLDELRARRAAPATPAPPGAAHHPPAAQLEAQLAAERLAHDCVAAKLHESETLRAAEAAELQRLRGEQWEAARRGEGLARAQQAVTRSAELAQRYRHELLLLSERERSLHVALQSACSAPPTAGEGAALGAARAEARAAREEAEAAAQRAEAASQRAHDLEQALNTKEAALGAVRRAARAAGEEHAARLQALQDKYRALLHVQRRMELRALERRAAPPSPPPSAPAAGPAADGPSSTGPCFTD